MTLRPCIDCGTPAGATRCAECTTPAREKTNTDHPAYRNNGRWKNLSKRLRRQQPWCLDCGTDRDLTVDHVVRVADRPDWAYEIAALAVRCRRCNSKRSNREATAEEIAEIEAKILARKRRRTKDFVAGGEDPRSYGAIRPRFQANFASHIESHGKIYGEEA